MRFSGAVADSDDLIATIIGAPFDGTATYRAGTRFGPRAIREASESLESYSPFLDYSLEDFAFTDRGDLELPPGSASRAIQIIADAVREALDHNLKTMILGGEHTITLGAVEAMKEHYPDLYVLQLDAHTDLRSEYLGEKLSHATIMRRVIELVGEENIVRFGVRAGTKEEMEESGIALPLGLEGGQRDMELLMQNLSPDRPLYVTIDLDVFDPSLIPGIGNPEPMGITYREFIQVARLLSRLKVVGADVVELAPPYDPSGVSAVIAASVVRELLLVMALSS
ncbi:MAG: agmatinase [bacterium]